jgi:phosphoglycerate dehydrogenase-like enzyme
LATGHLRAAVLDVMTAEPLPADSPLWDAPGVYLSPHSSNTEYGSEARLADLFATNIVRYCTGQPLINERDPTAGY